MVRTMAVLLALASGCKSNATSPEDSRELEATVLGALKGARSAEAVLLQLGHAKGAEAFSDERDDFSFDSSVRSPKVALSAAQLETLKAALLSKRTGHGVGWPHYVFHANVGLRLHGSSELRVIVGLDQFAKVDLTGSAGRIILSAHQERPALLALMTELFGADAGVTDDIVAPGSGPTPISGSHETY